MFKRRELAILVSSTVCCLVLAVAPAWAQGGQDLFQLSLNELANVQVTSVSKRPERLADAAASVFVITAEDIRRSGALNLSEALQLAPNLHVAEVSSTDYANSTRGGNSDSANKLLVLIDGRSIYTPLFSGVFWDVQLVPLEEIERIEVISGPGGTLWGTNAVNGVINVITRRSSAKPATYASVGSGPRQHDATVEYGAAAGSGWTYRLYAQYLDRPTTYTAYNGPAGDAMYRHQAGFRADWSGGPSSLSLEGAYYAGAQGQPRPGTIVINGVDFALGLISVHGSHLLARWETTLDSGTSLSWQTYVDRTYRQVIPTFAESLDIVDTQLQANLAQAGMHAVSWGAGYRVSSDHLVNSPYVAFLPAQLHQHWSNLFVQDELSLDPAWRLTLGARVERNDYTGNEFLPNARLAWRLAPEHLLWTALSRAVRAPSRLDRDTFVPGSPPFLLTGGAPVRSEVANVAELGYRRQGGALNYALTLFRAQYAHLRTQEIAPSGRSVYFASNMEGESTGLETWGSWQATRRLRLSAGWVLLHEHLHLVPGSNDITAPTRAGSDPAHKLTLRADYDLGAHSQIDLVLRRVGGLSFPEVPPYTAIDLHLGWQATPHLEWSLNALNLVGPPHAEWSDIGTRSIFGRALQWRLTARY